MGLRVGAAVSHIGGHTYRRARISELTMVSPLPCCVEVGPRLYEESRNLLRSELPEESLSFANSCGSLTEIVHASSREQTILHCKKCKLHDRLVRLKTRSSGRVLGKRLLRRFWPGPLFLSWRFLLQGQSLAVFIFRSHVLLCCRLPRLASP